MTSSVTSYYGIDPNVLCDWAEASNMVTVPVLTIVLTDGRRIVLVFNADPSLRKKPDIDDDIIWGILIVWPAVTLFEGPLLTDDYGSDRR